jgi:hypothetical protein
MNGIASPEAGVQLVDLIKALVGAGVLSMAMPLVVSVIIQQGWSRPAKEATVLASSVAVAVLGVIAAGMNPLDVAIALPVLVALTRRAYIDYWKPSGLAPWLEQVTSWHRNVPA